MRLTRDAREREREREKKKRRKILNVKKQREGLRMRDTRVGESHEEASEKEIWEKKKRRRRKQELCAR